MTKYSTKYEGKYKDIISDWGDQYDCLEFETKIDKWLDQFENEDRKTALRLVSKFQMYRRIYLEDKIKDLYKKFQKHLKGEDVNSLFMLLNSTDRLPNSIFFAFECKKILKNVTIHQDIKSLTEDELPLLNSRMVLIDDYIGSGHSLQKTLTFLIQNFPQMKSFKFYVLAVNVSEVGLNAIREFSKKQNLKINLIYCDSSSKAFKENYIFNTKEFESIRKKYKELCDKFNIESPFGYKETESLIAFDSCIPNNNLATFRSEGEHDGIKLIPLFKREENFKDNLTKLREEKIRMRKMKQSTKKNINIDFKTQIFVLYCSLQGKKLEFGKACKLFGYTYAQFNKKLNSVLERGLLIQAGERFAIGPNFENTFKERSKINTIIKNMSNKEIFIDNEDFYDIINYTPIDFENRFKGYLEE